MTIGNLKQLLWKLKHLVSNSHIVLWPLTHELRNIDIPVVNFTPSKGQDKHARINAVAPLFESGKIYAPLDREYAEEMIEEVAAFPFGENDDLVDSMTQALLRYRQGGLITHPEDVVEPSLPRGKKSYYW